MNVELFIERFPMIAAMLTIGCCTTVQYNGHAYSFKKTAPGQFIQV